MRVWRIADSGENQQFATHTVKVALENELRRIEEALPLREKLRPLQQRVLARPATGLEADKAFYDELSGNT